MASIIQNPALLDLQYSLKETLSFPIPFKYKSSTGVLTVINLGSYTFSANAYQGGMTIALEVATTNPSLGIITLKIGKGLLAAKKGWTWDLVVTDAVGNSRVVLAGSIAVTDASLPGQGGGVLINNYGQPAVL